MKNKIILTALAAFVLTPFSALAEEAKANAPAEKSAPAAAKTTSTPAGWTDDFEAAKKQAAKDGKDLFVVFSGTDWCGWCVRLEKDILSQDGFFEGVSENFVPVFIDRPRDKELLSDLGKKQNEKLCEDYRIEGFPTVLLMDPDGDVFAKLGYDKNGPQKYLERIAASTETGKASEEYKALKAISALPEGPNRIKQLDELLSALPLEVQLSNIDYVNEVLAADPNGTLGFRAKYPYFTTVLPIEAEVQEQLMKFSRLVQKANKEGKMDSAYRSSLEQCAPAFAQILEKVKKAQEQFEPESMAGKRLKMILLNTRVLFNKFEVKLPEEKPESK